ncbi:hypothetical protein IMZ48_17055 [Candidatus Bathyarchaeota archaeon]|nr:hypothetical protein [Candidatus Bathyarchaeota archaeon]
MTHSPDVWARAGGDPPVAQAGQRVWAVKRTTSTIWARLTKAGVQLSRLKETPKNRVLSMPELLLVETEARRGQRKDDAGKTRTVGATSVRG